MVLISPALMLLTTKLYSIVTATLWSINNTNHVLYCRYCSHVLVERYKNANNNFWILLVVVLSSSSNKAKERLHASGARQTTSAGATLFQGSTRTPS